jgi:O-antigen ligase
VLLIAYSRFSRVSALLGFAVFLVTLLLYLVIENNIEEIIKTLGLSGYFRLNTLSEGSGRFTAWAFAWQQVEKETFFIGKGFGYDEHFMRPYYPVLSRLGHQGGVHNSFLSFWLDVGLVGLLIFLRSYILMFIKAAKKNPLAFPVMFSVTFTAIFESWMVGSLNPFTIIMVVIATLMIEPEFYKSPEQGQAEDEEDANDLQPEISNEVQYEK